MNRRFTLIAALLGFFGVALGAFGAHALRDALAARQTTELWRTAVLYHLLHAIAVLALARGGSTSRFFHAAMKYWTLGVVLFSGSLYGLALGGPHFLGFITPLGGMALLVGWVLVFVEAWTARNSEPSAS